MDNRKSLGHVLGENANSSTAGSLRRRSSITFRPPNINLNVNDDEAERAALRLESDALTTPSAQSASNRRSLNLEAVIRMSSPQVTEGIAECIRLNTQNKINMKNAFSLNMIDFMSWMVRNQEKDASSNLQMAAVSLDISAKIYGLRVDGLHHDILKIMGNLDPKDNKPEKESEEGSAADDEIAEDGSKTLSQLQKKRRRKKNNVKIFSTIEALQGKRETVSLAPIMFGEVDCQTSKMLYQIMLPQHCTQSLALHAYNDVIIEEVTAEEANNNEKKIPWPPVQPDVDKEFNAIFSNFEFLDWSSEQEDNTPSQSQDRPSDDDNLAFDLNASLPPDNGPDDQDMNFMEMNDDDGDGDDDEYHQVACQAGPSGPIRQATLNNIIDNMPSRRLEYSLFDYALDIRWAGPSHWKIKTFVKNLGTSKVGETCMQNPMKKKKEMKLEFVDDIIKDINNKFTVSKKNQTQLKLATIKYSWAEEKLILQKEGSDDMLKEMCKFYLRPDDFIKLSENKNANATVLDDESEEYNYNNLNDTMNYCPNIETDDIPVDDENSNDYIPEADAIPSGFVGTNLIEAPKLTQKVFIPFSQRAKKLDMRYLKKCIWNDLTTDEQNDKENVELKDTNQNVSTVKGEKSFTTIFENLPNKLNKYDAGELSFPIAFVSLLHLANEKCLKISSNEDFSNVTIQQDVPQNINIINI